MIKGEEAKPLKMLLPNAFGPLDLGKKSGFLNDFGMGLLKFLGDKVERAAFNACNFSYAPYSQNFGGVAFQTPKGVATGIYIENAAFNPSLSPMVCGLVVLRFLGVSANEVSRVVIAHKGREVDHVGKGRGVFEAAGGEVKVEEFTFEDGKFVKADEIARGPRTRVWPFIREKPTKWIG